MTIVFNNNAYGDGMRDQKMGFGNRLIGSILKNPDFMTFASSFGVRGHRVTNPKGLREALTVTLQDKGPVLIEVIVPQGSEASPWDFIQSKR